MQCQHHYYRFHCVIGVDAADAADASAVDAADAAATDNDVLP